MEDMSQVETYNRTEMPGPKPDSKPPKYFGRRKLVESPAGELTRIFEPRKLQM
jgi:hypothetical protein